MAELTHIDAVLTTAFAHEVFDPLRCSDAGIVVLEGASSWGAHAAGAVAFPEDGRERVIPVAYDERRAPYAVLSGGTEDATLLLSLSDEKEFVACAWARREAGSPLLGVGVDLVSPSAFDRGPVSERFVRLIFNEHERDICREGFPDDPLFGYAVLFGAKEAAFKACAAPLRAWVSEHGELPGFEVRHFATTELGHIRGDQRDGAAQAAMNAMGLRIETHHLRLPNLALVVACALNTYNCNF